MYRSLRASLLAAVFTSTAAQAQAPLTPNQIAEQNRRAIEASRQESRENLERGQRGEIDPAEIRRAREEAMAESSVPTEVVARWQALEPQQLAADFDFVAALQRDDPAALAHWEGVLMEMNQDLRADAGSRAWMGGPVHVPTQDSIDFMVRDRTPTRPSRRREAPQREEAERPQRERNPIHERDALERALREAGRRYDDAMRARDDDPGNPDHQLAVERERAGVEQAEARYQAFLRENAPGEARARQQQRDAIEQRMENPRQLGRDQLPPRRDPAERPRAPQLQEYDGRQGVNPDHRLRGTPDGGEGPILRRGQSSPAERPAALDLPEYDGPRGTNPDHRMRGTPETGEGPVLPSMINRAPAPQRPQAPQLPEYQPPE